MARKAFPVVATIFFFVLFNAWIALFLVPLYQAVGFGSGGLWDFELKAHLIRPAGTDINMPLALALISFVFVEYWGIRVLGLGYFKKFFAFGNLLGPPQGLTTFSWESGADRDWCAYSFTFRLWQHDRPANSGGDDNLLVPFVANIFAPAGVVGG